MRRELRLGVFVVVTLLILAAAVFLIGSQKSLFKSTYTLNTTFKNAVGLVSGAEVRVAGIREGTVKQLVLPKRSGENLTVVMNMEDATRGVLKKDSLAAIKNEGLLGDKYVEITFGSPNAPSLKNGDTIASEPPLDISDLIKKTDQILDTTQGSLNNMQTATDNLASISSKVNEGKGTIGGLINDPTIYRQASQGAASFADDMEALKHNFLLRGFFHKRGYEDPADLTKNALAQLPAATPTAQFTYDVKQLFDKPATAKLKHAKELNEAGSKLEQGGFGLAIISVNGPATGDSDKDRLTTEAQSTAIREYLVQNFKLDDTRIKTLGLGKAKDDAESGKVAVLVYGEETKAPAAQKGPPSASAKR
ncbi:MAG TPA: MlaD family protein [Bryobacteraceae bacterium]|nr:MlaD family protein [Bryobacteraceae bacterium]